MPRAVKREHLEARRAGRGGSDADEPVGGPVRQGAAERRVLRSKYLAVKSLINDKKRDISGGSADNFNSIISEVETLHQLVQKPREQVADAEALLDIANTLVTSVQSFKNEGVTPSDFISFLLRKFGQNNGVLTEGSSNNVLAWNDLGVTVSHIFKKAPGCCTMLGPMNLEVKQRKTRVGQRSSKPTSIERPKEVHETGEEKTDTDKNMSTMFNILRRKRSVRLENLVLNRNSFAQTVENIFALSFLVKDGRAHLSINDKGHHIVSPKNAPSAAAVASGEVTFTHFVFTFGSSDWELMKGAVVAGEELMPNRAFLDDNTAGSEFINMSNNSELPDEIEDVKPSVGHRTPIRKLTRNRGLVVQDNQTMVEDTPEQEHNAGTGADGNIPPLHQNGAARGNRASADENGRAVFVARDSRPHSGMEGQIHKLEQEAYTCVLRALKAQSDAMTWEKESLITELRKELRVTDEEHRGFLGKVNQNGDEIIRRASGSRQEGGLQAVPARPGNQKTSKTIPSVSKGIPPPVPKKGLLGGARPKKPKAVPPDDIRCEGKDLGTSGHSDSVGGHRGKRRMTGKSTGGTSGAGRGTESVKEQSRKDDSISSEINGACKRKLDDIYIVHTDTLIKKVQKVFNATNPDPREIEKAKKSLKEHEQVLAASIAKLKDAS